jgi:hypothetical protein
MYPMVPDVIRGVQHTLMQTIMPDLRTDYARAQIGAVLLLLQHLLDRWDRARESLQKEHADLRRTLDSIAGAGGPGGSRSGGTERATAVDDAARSGEALLSEIRELRARLSAVMDTTSADAEVRRFIDAFLVRQLARERAAVANTAPTWD